MSKHFSTSLSLPSSFQSKDSKMFILLDFGFNCTINTSQYGTSNKRHERVNMLEAPCQCDNLSIDIVQKYQL